MTNSMQSPDLKYWQGSGSAAAPAPPATTRPSSTSTVPVGAWMAITGGALMAVSAFLPWVSAQAAFASISRNAFQLGNGNGFSADGLILVVLGLITVLVGITRLTKSAMPRYLQRSTIVTGIGPLLVAINRGPSIHSLVQHVNSSASGIVSASIGFGLWVAGLAGIIALVGGLILRSKS
jgi:hypothetical protein